MTAATQEKTAVATIPQRVSLVQKFASKYSLEADRLLTTLKATAFRVKDGEATTEQLAALLVVADQYDLNPFTREIFAFPDKQNGIVPVVSLDGWVRIINEHPQMDGVEFRYSDERVEPGDKRFPGLKWTAFEWIESVIYRKDRSKPVVVREFFEEVYRAPFTYKDGGTKESAWQTHSKRFHRHKALIQGGRIAFGFAGIYDPDEAERIVEGTLVEPMVEPKRGAAGLRQALVGTDAGQAGAPAANAPAAKISDKPDFIGTPELRDKYAAQFARCGDIEVLDIAKDESNLYTWPEADKAALEKAYLDRRDALEK